MPTTSITRYTLTATLLAEVAPISPDLGHRTREVIGSHWMHHEACRWIRGMFEDRPGGHPVGPTSPRRWPTRPACREPGAHVHGTDNGPPTPHPNICPGHRTAGPSAPRHSSAPPLDPRQLRTVDQDRLDLRWAHNRGGLPGSQPSGSMSTWSTGIHISAGQKRAPGATRTHTERILSPLPLPVGLRGPRRSGYGLRGVTGMFAAETRRARPPPGRGRAGPRSGRSRAGRRGPRGRRCR